MSPEQSFLTAESKFRLESDSVFYDVGHDIHIGLPAKSDTSTLQQVEQREEIEWDRNDFGSLEDYKKYNSQSRVYAALKEGECVGLTRIFAGYPETPPFAEMPFYSEEQRKEVLSLCGRGEIEEVGTVAVNHELSKAPKHFVALHLWRLAYRDAVESGMQNWGIIMEPRRVEVMNQKFHFTFEQLGPAIPYQGGDCAAFVMNLQEVDKSMSEHLPELYEWFVKEPLVEVSEAS
ncbi:hypothetical protein BH23PAT2_BH23PAT2_06850 [soil metagenome]